MIDGILNVYKEKGYTSHDVVAKLRGILKMKKIGHTGTLDPDAEGVLPVCLGKGTKLCDLLTEKEKSYEAVLLLGRETDTQDITGRTLEERPTEATEEELRQIISGFIGTVEQIPPMYSAIKVNGQKLYQLARAGREIDRPARQIQIYNIVIEEISLPRVRMRVDCSKGTYIRTLCHDIGRKAGCGGCMEALIRLRSGMFSIENSLKLREIEELSCQGSLEKYILPVDQFFSGCPSVRLNSRDDARAHNGNPLPWQKAKENRFRVYDSEGRFIGVYEKDEKKQMLTPWKMFYSEHGR